MGLLVFFQLINGEPLANTVVAPARCSFDSFGRLIPRSASRQDSIRSEQSEQQSSSFNNGSLLQTGATENQNQAELEEGEVQQFDEDDWPEDQDAGDAGADRPECRSRTSAGRASAEQPFVRDFSNAFDQLSVSRCPTQSRSNADAYFDKNFYKPRPRFAAGAQHRWQSQRTDNSSSTVTSQSYSRGRFRASGSAPQGCFRGRGGSNTRGSRLHQQD